MWMMKLNNEGEEEILDRIFFKYNFCLLIDFKYKSVESKKYFFIINRMNWCRMVYCNNKNISIIFSFVKT